MTEICPDCGDEFSRISGHWAQSKCRYPKLSSNQKKIITGLLMGDGTMGRSSKNPWIQANMITEKYLHYLDDNLGIISNGVKFHMTAEENAHRKRQSGFRPNANKKDYSDIYVWRSKCLPELIEFSEWYNSGKKVFPEDIELSPTVLKNWYVCDGCWNNKNGCAYISISIVNERENTEKIEQYFRKSALPTPEYYSDTEYTFEARWGVESSKRLLEYMGSPLPGFEYKWPDRFNRDGAQ